MPDHDVMTFRADCHHCGATFPCPVLGDSAYGEFILRGERGRANVYLNSFDEPAWKVVDRLFRQSIAIPPDRFGWEAALFQGVVAECSDPVDGERVGFRSPVCPQCMSTDVRYGAGQELGVVALPPADFSTFMSLSEVEREARVAAFIANARGDTTR